MNIKHPFGNNNLPKNHLSSSISLDSDSDFEHEFAKNNPNEQKEKSSFNTYSVPLSSNKNQESRPKRRSSTKVLKNKKHQEETQIKLQPFNSSCSLPIENDFINIPNSDSDNDQNYDIKNEIMPKKITKEKEQISNDSTCQKRWKKIFSKMFSYDNKESNIKNSDERKTDNCKTNDIQKPKELHILMNKKETKKLMKMKSESKHHRYDTLTVLTCTKGNIVKKFKNNVYQGIPNSLRGTVWQTIIDPFHSFCIKLKPETASLINDFKSNSIETSSASINEKDKNTRESLDNQINNVFPNQTIENNPINDVFSNKIENEPSNHSTNSTPSSTENNDSNMNAHSIKYVKMNLHTNQNLVQFLADHASSNVIRSIEGDIGRTLIQFKKMQNSDTQLSLKNILAAYSVVDDELGYAQGMGFIAAILLLYMDENSSFNCFCNIMLSKRFEFRNLFLNGFPRIQVLNKVWNVALQSYFPHLERKLVKNNIDPMVYTVGWWMANFLNFPLPDDVLLLLFDRNLLFGSMSLISFGLTIIGICYEYLDKSEIDEMISLLQMPSNHPKMLDSKEVISQWNNNFWISKKNYAKLLKKANVSNLP